MKHLGDVSKVSGYEVEPVDVVVGGSPCQDLSVAGKRAGFKHADLGDDETTRSGLFMEQMRIIREMREHDRQLGRTDDLVRPRWLIWENVPGAFSSGHPKGADFAAVIEEILKICEPDADVRVLLPSNGKWTKSGCYYDSDGRWSIAWRVHDGQFFGTTYFNADGSVRKYGTPQRRKRIALVADFGGLCAPEVLFERKGLHRHSEQGRPQGKSSAGSSEESIGESDSEIPPRTLKVRGGERSRFPGQESRQGCADSAEPCDDLGSKPRSDIVYSIEGNGARPSHRGSGISHDVSFTLNAVEHHAVAAPTFSLDEKMGQTYVWEEQANTLAQRDYKQPQCVSIENDE